MLAFCFTIHFQFEPKKNYAHTHIQRERETVSFEPETASENGNFRFLEALIQVLACFEFVG